MVQFPRHLSPALNRYPACNAGISRPRAGTMNSAKGKHLNNGQVDMVQYCHRACAWVTVSRTQCRRPITEGLVYLSTSMPGRLCASRKGTTMAQSIMIAAINRPRRHVFVVVANAETVPRRRAGIADGRRASAEVSGVPPSASPVPCSAPWLGRRSAWRIASDQLRVWPCSGDHCPRTLAALRRWLRRLFGLLPLPARPAVNSREAEWLTRSAVPTEADEAARLRDEENRDPSRPRDAPYGTHHATFITTARRRRRSDGRRLGRHEHHSHSSSRTNAGWLDRSSPW